MNTRENDPSEPAKDAARRADSPKLGADRTLDIQKLVATMLRKSHISCLWRVTAVGGGPISPELSKASQIPVEVQLTDSPGRVLPQRVPALLTRGRTASSDDEFTLRFEGMPSAEYTPYAVWVGVIKEWSFPAETLGKLPAEAGKVVELADRRAAGGPEGFASPPSTAAGVSTLAASSAKHEQPFHGLADSPQVEELHARNKSLDIHWHQGLLEIKVDCPLSAGGQAVILETEFINQLGERRSATRAVTLTADVEHGELAGYGSAVVPFDAPRALNLAEDQFRITVRPLRAEDLPYLNAGQVDRWLAGQDLRVLNMLEEGFAMRFIAKTVDQKRAATASNSSWLIRATAQMG